MPFDNDKATDAERAAFLNSKDALVENHGDEDDPEWVLFYRQSKGERSMVLDAMNYKDALYEACNFLRD